jgi:hypothetical protein
MGFRRLSESLFCFSGPPPVLSKYLFCAIGVSQIFKLEAFGKN